MIAESKTWAELVENITHLENENARLKAEKVQKINEVTKLHEEIETLKKLNINKSDKLFEFADQEKKFDETVACFQEELAYADGEFEKYSHPFVKIFMLCLEISKNTSHSAGFFFYPTESSCGVNIYFNGCNSYSKPDKDYIIFENSDTANYIALLQKFRDDHLKNEVEK
ncbi:hypothetical protein AAEX28_12410 [Lentisphaerota bacterium WC36G]|nr:hypothetical protein LJT99_15235 [Lentisphaerae bacterium WC36]